MSFEAIYGANSRVLILGTYPSPRSRETGFYYGHPQNRFWKVLAFLFGESVPQTIPEKRSILLRHGLALWDVCADCEVVGASDASIREVCPNAIPELLRTTGIRQVFCNGTTALKLYNRYILPQTAVPAVLLPSTSPANAQWRLEQLTEAWSVIRNEGPNI